ncbi:MAG: hypothetical protein QUV05_17220 [Phycisphaerae bacterium]|nr:hypothetical protein [Phycisphaerae bacterium]
MEVLLSQNRQMRGFRRHGLRGLLIGLLTVGLGSGCSSWSSGSSKSKSGGLKQLNPRGVAFLEEVPVPDGFHLVDKHSMDQESAGQRMARHEYQGRADPFAVRDFYRQQMPQMGWERVSDQSLKGVITMRFEKKLEVCTVQIQSGHFGRSIVNVEVVPFSRTPMEPPKQR